MLARLGKVIFWFTLNVAVIDFHTTMLLCIVVIGVGLGVLVSLAGSDYVYRRAARHLLNLPCRAGPGWPPPRDRGGREFVSGIHFDVLTGQ
jgi:hypothetical protein